MLAAFLTFCIPLETSSHTADLAQTHTQTHWEKYHKCINTLNYLLSHTNLWIASISAAEVAKKTEQNRTTLVGHGVLRRPTIHTEANLLFLSISPHTLFHKQSHTLDCHMGTHVKGWQRERGREKREKVPAANCLTKVSSTHIQIHPANSQPLLCKGGKADEEVMRGALWLWSPLIPFHFLPFLNVPIFSHFLLSFLLLHIIPCSLISNFSFTMTSSSPRPPHTYPMDWPQALLSPTLLFLPFSPFSPPLHCICPFLQFSQSQSQSFSLVTSSPICFTSTHPFPLPWISADICSPEGHIAPAWRTRHRTALDAAYAVTRYNMWECSMETEWL